MNHPEYPTGFADGLELSTLDVVAGLLVAVGGGIIACLFFWGGTSFFLMFFVGSLFLLAILLSPFVGLCLVMASIPIEGILVLLPNAFTLTKALAGVLALSYFIRLLFTENLRNLYSARPLLIFLVLMSFSLLYIPFSREPFRILVISVTSILMWGLSFLVALVPKTQKQLGMACVCTTISASGLGMYIIVFGTGGLVQTWGEHSKGLEAGLNENNLAFALGLSLILSTIAWRSVKRWGKVMIIGLDFLIVFAIGLTNSRGEWLALFMGVTIAIFLSKGTPLRQRLMYLTAALAIMLVGFALVLFNVFGDTGHLVSERLSRLTTDPTRTEWLWPTYLKLIVQSPLWGWGPGVTHDVGQPAHNDMLQVGAEYGFLGLAIYFALLVTLFRTARKLFDSWLRLATIGLFFFIILSGFTSPCLRQKSFALGIGIILCLGRLMTPNSRLTALYGDEYDQGRSSVQL
jgi:O-antigen ligase